MKKIQTQLFISFFSVSLLVMASLLLTFYLHIRQQATDELSQAHQEIVIHTATSIDSMTNMLLFALNDSPFQRQFKSILNEDMDKDPYEALQFQKQVDEMFRNYSDTYQNLQVSYYVALYGLNDFRYCSMDHFDFDVLRSGDFYSRILAADGKVVWDQTQEDPYLPTSSKNVFAMERAIKSGKNYTASGILAIIIDEDSLYRIYRSGMNQEKSRLFISSGDGIIMSAEDKSLIGTGWNAPAGLADTSAGTLQMIVNENGENILYSLCRLSSSNWWIVEAVPINILQMTGNRFLSATGLGFALCFLFSITLSWMLSRKISRPIHQLNHGMEQIASGNLKQALPDYSVEEFNRLIHSFNRMSNNIQELIEEVRRNEAEKYADHIRLLQLQINPHFIYNTLNSIRCMILIGENKAAADTMIRIIGMMRNILSTEKLFITFSDELKNLENYLEIEKSVYYNELNWNLDIAPNTRMLQVPKLILQPLVENSIFHGIMPNNINGLIEIHTEYSSSVLHIVISDNGIMDPEKRKELSLRLSESFSYSGSGRPHIGLYNTNQRIKYIYGDEYGIELLPCTEKTSFHLWFPPAIKKMPELVKEKSSGGYHDAQKSCAAKEKSPGGYHDAQKSCAVKEK